MAWLPLRTRLFTTLLDRGVRGSIIDMDLAEIQRSRAFTAPLRRPFTWITGAVPRDVRIGDAWFTTRDGVGRQVRTYLPSGRTGGQPSGAARGAPAAYPVVVFFHGGGWVLGNTRMYDPLCATIAARAEALVVSVDYRMAPEHRAPTAVHDAVDATRWLADEGAARLGGDPTRIAVCGDSAGGNLAALVCHAALDDGGPAIAHQALIYPGVDLSMSMLVREHANAPVLTQAKIEAFLRHYLGPDPQLSPRDPSISPYWRESLRGLPPALVQTADLDPLRDEGLAYAARLTAADVPTRVTNYLGAVHGFASFPGMTLIGRQATLELVTELHRHLHPAGSPTTSEWHE